MLSVQGLPSVVMVGVEDMVKAELNVKKEPTKHKNLTKNVLMENYQRSTTQQTI